MATCKHHFWAAPVWRVKIAYNDEEYCAHINSKDNASLDIEDTESTSNSESESVNEYPLSDVKSSSSEDELWNVSKKMI